MPFGTKESENKDMITYTSKKDLENNFIAHWKNPEKYVAFKLNDETFPYASGFYVLRPFYQKLKICTDEKDDYAIDYSSYDKKWRLIRNPLYNPIIEMLDLEENTIATLLEGEEFSYVYNNEEDIIAFKTFENVISKNKRAGKEFKKLKTEIETLTTNNDALMTQNDNLNNQLIDGTTRFKNLEKDYQIMEEEKKFAFLKRAETFNENENLRQELEKQKYEIQKQRKEIETLQSQIGGLSYDLNNMKEMEKEIENLKKENGNLKTDVEPLKNKNKKLNQEIKRLNNQIKISQNQMSTKENTLARIEEMELKMDEESEAIMCSIKSLEETTSEFMDATTIFRNMTRRYEMLITQLEQKKLSDDIQRLEIMKNKNHCEEINQLKEKVDLKRQLFDFCSENYSSTLKFLKNEIQLESELLNGYIMRKKEITKTEKNETEEVKCIESKIRLYKKASENHVKELQSCKEIYIKLQHNILDFEENYAKIIQLLIKE